MQTYRFSIWIPLKIQIPELGLVSREEFFDWLWSSFGSEGLEGIHEGTLLSEEAAESGLETDSWLLDAAQAPASRDWIGQQENTEASLYFSEAVRAEKVRDCLKKLSDLKIGPVEEVPDQDWNAEWKASFLSAEEGIEIPPIWRIFPPWKEAKDVQLKNHERFLKVNPGAGFGTGTHETTQLCLRAIGEWGMGVKDGASPFTLDFGSGSGILAIGLALLGAKVDAVEVDSLAIDNARENAALNGVEDRIEYFQSLPQRSDQYDLIVANILKPILIENARLLTDRLSKSGVLILSGLIEKDVRDISEIYSSFLGGEAPEIRNLGEWYSVRFKNSQG
ncbi:MAG: 50S ribosomal protein L11 methyltransferase [Bdellovibrio sp.]|nr:50S ribosomal protein L11 methyltransferase [Bdellovibrio sp.]